MNVLSVFHDSCDEITVLFALHVRLLCFPTRGFTQAVRNCQIG
jgi:hypothetical protein